MKRALLVIDVQNAMIHVDEPVYHASVTIENIQKIIKKARLNNIPVIYIQHNEIGSEFEYGIGSWQIADEIKPYEDDVLIHKTSPDSFNMTNLKQVLDTRLINDLVVVGMQTDYCVNATSLRALELGYRVTIIKDAHSTWGTKALTADKIIDKFHALWLNKISLIKEKDFYFK
jgi:nicotinamidase-related amidase